MTQEERRLMELRKSVSQMTDEELYEHIGISRNNRRTPAPKPKAKAKKKAKSTGSKVGTSDSLEQQLSNLTPEQAAEILKKLQA